MNQQLSNTDAPIIQRVDALLAKAIRCKASDIHLESTDKGLRVRFRIDGVLFDQSEIDKASMEQVISRLKVMAHINIAQRRIPQDGKFVLDIDQDTIDLRVSTFPSLHGEKMVVRILDRGHNKIALGSLGMGQPTLEKFRQLLAKSNGFFLVTGPTGSGKTTTLYAALSALSSPEKNIITLEDPVEYAIAGITQGQIHPEAGFTFAKGIRAILRQDPDVLMVGEIRDKETASTAIEAALTGHVVLSTLHTNDAPSVIMRLMDMGVEPFLLNAAITGVLAQRLARKICNDCKVQEKPNDAQKKMLDTMSIELDQVYKGAGCTSCQWLGYKGRTGIFELLAMTPELRSLIVHRPIFDAIYAQAINDGMHTLVADGVHKVQQGVITLDELARVVA